MSEVNDNTITMIPIDAIRILNPRDRARGKFDEIVGNIKAVGLKRPITVAGRSGNGGEHAAYDLVCGQGRMEALLALGETCVPARIISAQEHECLVASLVENCARRRHNPVDLLRNIGALHAHGVSDVDIASKTGLSVDYVHAVARLLEKGEERLLRAAATGQIPFTVALQIAEVEDTDIQTALQSAYERNLLRGRALTIAKRLVDARRNKGKSLNAPATAESASPGAIIRAFTVEAERKRALVVRAEKVKARIAFIVEATRRLLDDEILHATMEREGLLTLPAALAKRLDIKERLQ
ncbi:plasmid partitioning protein RepB C-terminal domain-containing protein [Rhizobium sp. BE258]|uniref:ParB/RepB/Spo0J family partition protein n=1 Tax=Rhizobium sp. BE258 TaxID=2817722 RepID=UPI0028548D11|nr:plasmid partitioning protein RepB C-terminal domain-containing protein [Rhizobium sp. BE258]MDR7145157.1 ParB family chromosome partitioning protein [Rhizobium sp. BE258]